MSIEATLENLTLAWTERDIEGIVTLFTESGIAAGRAVGAPLNG